MNNSEEKTTKIVVPPLSGSLMWNDESRTLEFISCRPVEESGQEEKGSMDASFTDLQQRAEWLAEVCTLNSRGRQTIRKRLSPAHLNEFRSSVMKRRGDYVTLDDVKQVAVGLIQENYLLPIPFCFLTVLKSKKLDEVLAALLLYLSCYFEQKSLENKSTLSLVANVTEQRLMAETAAKKEISLKKLAVRYFSLTMDLEIEQHRPNNKTKIFSNQTEWLFQACLYSFFCYFSWVTFNSQNLKGIQEEVGRLFFSDTFNVAVRERANGDPGNCSAAANGSANPEESRHDGAFKNSAPGQRPRLLHVVNQRSPLMMALLPLPRERSEHLFNNSSWTMNRRSRPHIQHSDIITKSLTEQLHQQLDRLRFGIIGQPLSQFSSCSLMRLRTMPEKGAE